MSQHISCVVSLLVILSVTSALADTCAKYKEFQDAWDKLKDPVAAGLSLESQKELAAKYDPRRLNTADIRNCTSSEKPPNQPQGVVIQSWPSTG